MGATIRNRRTVRFPGGPDLARRMATILARGPRFDGSNLTGRLMKALFEREPSHSGDFIHGRKLAVIRPCRIVRMFTFVETRLFSRLVYEYLSEEEYSSLQRHLAAWPASGDVIPGTGGVRKIRWAVKGRGKRGGVRVVYVARVAREVIWLLMIYAKNQTENIPAAVLRSIREELEK